MNLNRIAKFFRDYSLARFLLPAGLILIVFGCVAFGPVLTRQAYPEADAVVTRTELFEEEHYEGETLQEATYRIFVRYTVDGKEYEEEYGIFPEMQVGAAVKINYNPNNPADIGQPNGILLPIAFIAGGVVFLLGGIISIITTRKKNAKLKLQEEEWKHGS